MKFFSKNLIGTTTEFSTTNGTSTLSLLLDKNKTAQWTTDNANTDATTASLDVYFTTTQTVSDLVLLNHNLKDFSIFYNGLTANSWASTTTNSATSSYFTFSTVTTVERVTIDMRGTISANQEKSIGQLIATFLRYDFTTDRLPPADSYKPRVRQHQFVHEMSDGGVSVFRMNNKYEADIDVAFVPTASVETLKTIYDLGEPILFIPFETTSSWNAEIAEVAWTGEFTFLEYSDNNLGNGFTGGIELRQTPGGSF